MSYAYTKTNPNQFSDAQAAASAPNFTSLAGSTMAPSASMKILNPNDPSYKDTAAAFDQGLLAPNQSNKLLLGRSYYTISTGYGVAPQNLYAYRGCAM